MGSYSYFTLIKESLTSTDKDEISRISKKEIKDEIKSDKFEKVIKDIIIKQFNSDDFEKNTMDIIKNILIQYHKTLYNKRQMWSNNLENRKS